jgi:transposase
VDMSDSHPGPDRAGRRRKRFLTPAQKYEIWVQLLRGETTIRAAADEHGVDRSTILKLRTVARQGALDALARSKPGVRADGPDPELTAAKAEIARLSEALKEMSVRLMLVEGKGRWD